MNKMITQKEHKQVVKNREPSLMFNFFEVNKMPEYIFNCSGELRKVKKSAKANIYISEPITTYRYCLKTGKIEMIKQENKPSMSIVEDKLYNKKRKSK